MIIVGGTSMPHRCYFYGLFSSTESSTLEHLRDSDRDVIQTLARDDLNAVRQLLIRIDEQRHLCRRQMHCIENRCVGPLHDVKDRVIVFRCRLRVARIEENDMLAGRGFRFVSANDIYNSLK